MERKHPNVVNVSSLKKRVEERGDKFGYSTCRLGPEVGAEKIGASYFEIPPGKQAFPHHYHTANEEAAFVIEGKGLLRIGQDEVEIEAGDYIAFPVGPDHAHSIRNTSDSVLKLLCLSTLQPVEVVGYPDSKKFAVTAAEKVAKGAPWLRFLVKEQPSVDYYEGEL